MRLYALLTALLITVTTACHRSQPADNGQKLADSALAVHFKRVQKLRHYDTAGFEHKLLTAVYRRDSAFLRACLCTGLEFVFDRSITMITDGYLVVDCWAILNFNEVYQF